MTSKRGERTWLVDAAGKRHRVAKGQLINRVRQLRHLGRLDLLVERAALKETGK